MTEVNTEPERSGSLHAYFWSIERMSLGSWRSLKVTFSSSVSKTLRNPFLKITFHKNVFCSWFLYESTHIELGMYRAWHQTETLCLGPGLIYSLYQPHSRSVFVYVTHSVSTGIIEVKIAIVGSQDTLTMKKVSHKKIWLNQ
jgi:hypothetical protein